VSRDNVPILERLRSNRAMSYIKTHWAKKYSGQKGAEKQECAICLLEFKKNELLGEMPKDWKKNNPKVAPKKVEKQEENKKEEEKEKINELYVPKDRLSKMLSRDMASTHNKKEILEKHNAETQGKIHTRFPPEPNGYLHIGHAKAMRFSFTLAEDYGGNCYLRFDDTNPEKECEEYINSIKNSVSWLGYKPYKVTHTSDYFDKFYNWAIQLIKMGKAYVCHQAKAEVNLGRE